MRWLTLACLVVVAALPGFAGGAAAASPRVALNQGPNLKKAGQEHAVSVQVDSEPDVPPVVTLFVRGTDGRRGANIAGQPPVFGMAAHGGTGYYFVDVDGRVLTWGSSSSLGDLASYDLPSDVIGIATTASGRGYWLATDTGEVYSFGDAPGGLDHFRSELPSGDKVVEIVSDPGSGGYLLASATGRVFSSSGAALGDWSSATGAYAPVEIPVAGIVPTPRGDGYWLFDSRGRVAAFGAARFNGDLRDGPPRGAVTGMYAPGEADDGYMLVTEHGGTHNFSVFPYLGSVGDLALPAPIAGLVRHPEGGYWLFDTTGHVYAFGAARNYGSRWTFPSGTGLITFTSTTPGMTVVEAFLGDRPYGEPVATLTQTWTPGDGYWMLDAGGTVYEFGGATAYGPALALTEAARAVDLEPTPTFDGYWILDAGGAVHTRGHAGHYGNVEPNRLSAGETVTSLSGTPDGKGYWVFTSKGRVVTFGAARWYGDMAGVALNGPVLDSIPTPSGRGYYMVASDGGIFTFGDARFHGSMGGIPLNAPVQSLVPDGDGAGYWLVASDGGIFAFEAPFRGSMGATRLNRPVTGMVRFGGGYLMVAEDGGIFNFSDRPFYGSLGANPPAQPIVAVAALDPFSN